MPQDFVIYGGSFDPPHIAHLQLAVKARKMFGAKPQYLIAPCFSSGNKILTKYETRVEMCRKYFKPFNYTVIPFKYTYMIDLLHYINELYINNVGRLILIGGSDLFPDIHKWKDYIKFPPTTEIHLFSRTQGISSTVIRNEIKFGHELPPNVISDQVYEIIKREKLYVDIYT